MTSMDDFRAKFERVYSRLGECPHAIERTNTGAYKDQGADAAWEEWQRAATVIIDMCAARCRELSDCRENSQEYRDGAAWCSERIRAIKTT